MLRALGAIMLTMSGADVSGASYGGQGLAMGEHVFGVPDEGLFGRDRGALATLRRGGRAMNALADAIEKVAAASSNVLVVGESGTGKELVARALHECSPRAAGPLLTLNVAAIPDAFVESYLFGHEEGALPGADRRRDGLLSAASGGTLLLDEVGDLPLPLQAKLLRAVETKEILPVGAVRVVKVDTRIVAATHRDLGAMVHAGAFRHDLFYRLQVVELQIPPLRERAADIPLLAMELATMHARAQNTCVRAISPDAMARLSAHRWPGNVRELSNVLERAVILCSGDAIAPVDLPAEVGASLVADRSELPCAPPEPSVPEPSSGVAADMATEDACLERATIAFQRRHIARVLDAVEGNREAAAKVLGLSPATLYRYLQKVGLKGYGHG